MYVPKSLLVSLPSVISEGRQRFCIFGRHGHCRPIRRLAVCVLGHRPVEEEGEGSRGCGCITKKRMRGWDTFAIARRMSSPRLPLAARQAGIEGGRGGRGGSDGLTKIYSDFLPPTPSPLPPTGAGLILIADTAAGNFLE